MGTAKAVSDLLTCGEDHGPTVACHGDHSVVAEWFRASDYVRIGVDDKSITMTWDLFVELRKMMNRVDQ